MRILHVLAERGFSGGENQLLATVRYLQERGHQQAFVLDERARFRENVEELGLPATGIRYRNNYDALAAIRLRQLFRRENPELIHFACSRSHKIGAMASVCGRGLPPRVVTRRMDYPIGRTPFRKWIYRRGVQHVVAISNGVREAILRIGVDPQRVSLIHEGVDTEKFAAARKPERRDGARARFELAPGDFFGVTTASLHPRKAHDVLFRSLAAMKVPEGRRVVWLCGGDGPEREKLQSLAATMPERVEVRIPGQIDHVDEALAAADAFCLPSRYEGLGVALLEALSTGVPCVASRVGGMRDVLEHGVSGLHVEPEDVAGLTAALQGLFDDPVQAAALGAAGRERARSMFDVSIMGQKTEALYQRIIANRSVGSGDS